MALNVRQKGFELILALILFFAATLLLIFVRYIKWITLIYQLATDCCTTRRSPLAPDGPK